MWTKRKAINRANQAIDEYLSQAKDYRLEIEQLVGERDAYKLEYQAARLEIVSELLGTELDEQKLEQLSRDWGGSHLANLYQVLVAKQKDKLSERDELKSHQVIQNRYELLEADSATYLTSEREAEDVLKQDELQMKGYEAVEFQWLYRKKCHELKVESSLRKFWNVITLKAAKEKKYKAKVTGQFKESSLKSIVYSYEKLLRKKGESKQLLEDAKKVKKEAIELVSHFDELNSWEFNFEGIVRVQTEKVFSECFERLGPDAILIRVPNSLRELAAKVHAVSKKYDYASNLIAYLEAEEEDRNQRVQSISRVRGKWRRSPTGFVKGDKSKWLQSIPEIKKEGTRKRLGWSRKMRSCLFYYDDYGSYGSYHHSASCHNVGGFLAYDVFNYHRKERMPHEGFSREVIPEIQEFREDDISDEWLKELERDESDWAEEIDPDSSDSGDIESDRESGELDGLSLAAGVVAASGAAALASVAITEQAAEMEAIESIIEDADSAVDAIDDQS